jgi:tetratricopeptide (TPR) repeat protein
MTPEQHQSLVDQFDQRKGEMPIGGLDPANTEAHQEWELLELAVDAIQWHAINDQVRNARLRFEQEQRDLDRGQAEDSQTASNGVVRAAPVAVGKLADMVDAGRRSSSARAIVPAVRRRIPPMLQIAAALIVIVVSAGVIKVANTHPEDVFAQNYSEYQLSVTRGADASDALEQAYRSGNWAAVYTVFGATHNRTQKDYFLTAMAHTQQKEYYEAISLLKTLILYNQSREPYFQDEAEYYLAMNYLATGQAAQAVELFDKIKADPRHTYFARVQQMSKLDLGILRMK